MIFLASAKNKIVFLDTTLRDGEQMPGVHFSRAHKLHIATALEELGVDIIEAGFPASSKGDFKAVEQIASTVKKSTVCALARATKEDVDRAAEALAAAEKKRIHVFIATSDIHLEHKLSMTREELLRTVGEIVAYAKTKGCPVQFSAEDAGRTDRLFLKTVLETAIEAGADAVNVPDTVGYNMPTEFGELIRWIKENVKGIGEVEFGCHCHNDLGCAVANTLSAVRNGVDHVECTINGVGERAGNAALEEVAMALVTRKDFYKKEISIRTPQILRVSRLVSSLTAVTIPPNKAIVGENAFTHESGIHQHGVINDRHTYEIMNPVDIGFGESNLVLGKLSGRHAFADRCEKLGYKLKKSDLDECFVRFKNFAEKKAIVGDDDLRAIINEYLDTLSSVYKLENFQIQSGNQTKAMAMITLSCKGTAISEAALGDGPIDAAFNAINRLTGADDILLEEYNIKAVTEGMDALGEATVHISIRGTGYSGRSVSTDIIEASIRSYLNAINKWAALE